MFNTSPLPSLFLPHCILFLTDLHLNTARSAWYLPPPASTFRFYPREMGVFRKHLNSCLTSFMAVRVGQGLVLCILTCSRLNWSAVSREENGVNHSSINVTSPYAPRHYDPSTKPGINVHTCVVLTIYFVTWGHLYCLLEQKLCMWLLPLIINQPPYVGEDSKCDEGLKNKVVHFKDNAASVTGGTRVRKETLMSRTSFYSGSNK